MRSADLKNIIVNHAPNHHSKNPGWEYFPSSQIKCQVEAAQKKELAKPTPPSIKIKTLNLKANYISQVKPKHVFKKTDIKELGKQKREALQNWISEENNLRKGIQKPHKCKPAPPPKEEEPNDQWPEENEDQPQENNNNQEEEEQEEQQEEEEQEQQEEQEEQQEQNNQSEKIKSIADENEQIDDENQSQNNQQESVGEQNSQNQSNNQGEEQENTSLKQSVISQKNQSKIIENKSEVQSQVSNSFVQQKQTQVNKSINTSSLIGYKSQIADVIIFIILVNEITTE